MKGAPVRATARKVLHRIGPLHRALSRHRGTLIHRPSVRPGATLRLGSDYGGWTVLPGLLDSGSVVYSVGVGRDVTFDLALIERFGCTVHAFDPTPHSRDWVATQSLPREFVFHLLGLGDKDEEAAFAQPEVEGFASFGMPDDSAQGSVIHCPVRRLESVVRDLDHDRIDLLKMDIEGFEYGVIDDVLAGPLRPTQWLIEFHHAMRHFKPEQTRRAVAALEDAGYGLFALSNVGHEYSFVHRSALPGG